MQSQALWYVEPGRAELRAEEIATPNNREVQIRALFGAISRGTERLVYGGRVPATEYERMRCPSMAGQFPFPVKYGYSMVGRVEAGPHDLQSRLVFALHPHQTVSNLPAAAVFPVPDGVPAERAVLAANMETALNALWDGAPGPADRIAIVGGGVVGLLVAYLCGRLPGADVTLVDILPGRAGLARAIGARFAAPEAAPRDCDLVFHASGKGEGLRLALTLAGEEASIIELSWHGSADVSVPLGETFHSRRLRLISSQVGKVAPSRRPRWSRERRLAAALALLKAPALDALLAPPVCFTELPAKLAAVFDPNAELVCQVIRYPASIT
jgi:NADPH:quinone reductase-like Zn-dependent oxidoreductase